MTIAEQVERAKNRMDLAERGLDEYKDKIHRLRNLLAGNPDALIVKGGADDPSEQEVKRAFTTKRPGIFVTDIDSGRDNELLRAIRTLVMQTSYHFPEIEFPDLDFEEATVHSEYLRQRLGEAPIGCDAVEVMQRALYDFLTGGFGWSWIGMQSAKPTIWHVDTLDCKWDQTAPTVRQARWWSTTFRSSLSAWQSMFGPRAFDKYITSKAAQKDAPDQPVELEYYYDIEGSEGTFLVLFRTGETDVDMTPVFRSKNPCFWDYAGQRVPFLPAESLFFMEIPSARFPISLVEQMLPSQIALWENSKTIRQIVDCPAYDEIEEGSLDAKQLQNFEDGEVGGYVIRKKGSTPIISHPARDIPNALLEWDNQNRQRITGQSGANPYASGAPVEGTNYAAEVNAIQNSAGLMAGTIAKLNAGFWIRTVRKFLAKGAAFDEWPLIVRYEKTDLKFDETDPIRTYLKPDTRIVIREDSMQFLDQQTKLAMAAKDVEIAASVGPEALAESYKDYLKAGGKRDIEKYLPQAQPVPAPTPGMAPAPTVGG